MQFIVPFAYFLINLSLLINKGAVTMRYHYIGLTLHFKCGMSMPGADRLMEKWPFCNAVLGSKKAEYSLHSISKIMHKAKKTYYDAKTEVTENYLDYFLLPREGAAVLLSGHDAFFCSTQVSYGLFILYSCTNNTREIIKNFQIHLERVFRGKKKAFISLSKFPKVLKCY